jgi:hypothetical protein
MAFHNMKDALPQINTSRAACQPVARQVHLNIIYDAPIRPFNGFEKINKHYMNMVLISTKPHCNIPKVILQREK